VQRRPLTPTSFVDNHQIVEGRGAVKLGPVLILESPAPILIPIPRHPIEVGADIIYVDLSPHKLVAIKNCFAVISGSLTSFALSLLAMAY
jgi:hypothetical protein